MNEPTVKQIQDRYRPETDLLRLRAALEARNIPFPDCRYFENPSAFVNAVVAAHNRRDRLNEAIRQVEAVLGLIPKFQKQLEN